jgi:hypothetical protein
MRAETLLRKLRLQEALSEDELTAYLGKLEADGSLPPGEALTLLETVGQRTAKLSVDDIRAVASLAGGPGSSTDKAGTCGEDRSIRAIISKLAK